MLKKKKRLAEHSFSIKVIEAQFCAKIVKSID
jgi:hypothetical protein